MVKTFVSPSTNICSMLSVILLAGDGKSALIIVMSLDAFGLRPPAIAIKSTNVREPALILYFPGALT